MSAQASSTAVLIVVAGPPGTGKTVLSQRIAHTFGLPVVNRDSLKEILFDTLGWSDRAWSKRLGIASYGLLYYVVDAILSTGCSFIVESNFDPRYDNDKFRALSQRHSFVACQLLCRTEPVVLMERLRQRVSSGERHPGHVAHLEVAELDSTDVCWRPQPLALGGRVIELDTTDFSTIDYAALYASIDDLLKQA